MTINTKFEVGDEVVVIVDNEVHLTKVLSIQIGEKLYSGEYKDEDINYTLNVEENKPYTLMSGMKFNAKRNQGEVYSVSEFRDNIEKVLTKN